MFSTVGFFAYFFFEVKSKLPFYGVGVAIDMIANYGMWTGNTSKKRIHRSIFGNLLGLITLVSIRMGFRSLDPVWYTEQGPIIAIICSILCALFFYNESPNTSIEPKSNEKTSWLFSGMALGSIIFMTHVFWTEHGVVSRWVQLPPFPEGIFVILAMIVGLLVSHNNIVTTKYWFFFGLAGWILFASSNGTIFPPYVEFAGGLILAIYTISVWFLIIEQLSKSSSIGKSFLLGGLWYTFEQFWSVYVVAYKFVPLGFVLRERSKSLTLLPILFMGISHVQFSKKSKPKSETVHWNVYAMLVFIIIGTLVPSSIYRFNLASKSPINPNPPEIKPLAWAIHFGYDNNGNINTQGLANIIKLSGANIIGMVETDSARHFMGNRDIIEWLADELHYYSDFGPSTAENTWGCALLSVYPIIRVDRVVMPSPEGELACLINADVKVNNTLVNVIVSHFGNTEDKLDLELQANYLANLIAAKKDSFSPTVFIGYLTMEPFSERYVQLMQAGFRDSSNSLDRYCLYILYKDLQVLNFERYDKGDISDTEAQVGTFVLKSQPNLTLPSAEYCRAFNDSVSCQDSQVCGWCQLKSSGSCYEPEQNSGCLAFNGAWIGPQGAKTPIKAKEIQEFIQVQHQQQKKGIFPLDGKGENFIWTINGFHSLDSWTNLLSSSIFEFGESYWRLWIFIPHKRLSKEERKIELAVECVMKNSNTKVEKVVLGLLPGKEGSIQPSSSSFEISLVELASGKFYSGTITNIQKLERDYLKNDTFRVKIKLE